MMKWKIVCVWLWGAFAFVTFPNFQMLCYFYNEKKCGSELVTWKANANKKLSSCNSKITDLYIFLIMDYGNRFLLCGLRSVSPP